MAVGTLYFSMAVSTAYS